MTLDELLRQRADLDRQIAAYQSEGRSKALAEIIELMARHGLTAADLTPPPGKVSTAARSSAKKPVVAKYRDEQGNGWTGRGLKPKWLTAALASGRKIDDFTL